MRIRWSPEAADDFADIEHIHRDKPVAARAVACRIYEAIMSLRSFPNRGREGRITGSRELVLTPLPYIAVYRVRGEVIEISRIWHASRSWPPLD